MATFNAPGIVSEAEQLLFYSIPGSVFLLYWAGFLLLFQKLTVSTGLTAAAVVATIPVGFIIYQAYTANAFRIYQKVNAREEEATLKLIQEIIVETGMPDNGDLYRLSKRMLTVILNRSDTDGRYIWRLIGIVNARGACLLSTLCGCAVPVLYLTFFWVGWTDINLLAEYPKTIVYYVVLLLGGLSLYWAIPKLRKQLDIYNSLLIAENVDQLRGLVAKWKALDKKKLKPNTGPVTCPRCGNATEWNTRSRRYYCENCQSSFSERSQIPAQDHT